MTGRSRISPLAISAVAAAVALGALSALPAPSLAQDVPGEARVSDFVRRFADAVRTWDVDAWAELVTDDVVMMAPNGRVVEGRDAFHELWTRTFEGRTGVNPLDLRVRGVEAAEDLAVLRLDYGPEGREPVGQYVWTLVRRPDGSWGLKWWIFNRRSADG